VCACFGVGRERILSAIRRDRLETPQAIGAKLQAGTNCGSCVPELKALIAVAGR
jgi:assimilatory nitrate reductase catalytic subunit